MARGKVSVIPPALLTWAILGRPCFSSSDKFLFCWAAFLSISLLSSVFPLLFLRLCLIHARMWHLFNLANNNNIFNFAFSNLWWLKKPRIGCMISSYFIIGLDLLPSCNDFFMWMTYASYLYISLLTSCISRNKKEGTTLEFYYR